MTNWLYLGCRIGRAGLLLIVAMSLACPLGAWAQAAKGASGLRVALVVGNGNYASVGKLPNPANDARLVAATLQQQGFVLIGGGALVDLDRARFTQAIQEFGNALAGARVSLFYYSGHGLQVDGVNWLVPVDANPTKPKDLDFQMVDASLVLRQMDGSGTGLNVVILDACRNNPFAARSSRSAQAGLAEMRAPEGTIISYATRPGSVAADGTGLNSPYSAALAAAMQQPGVDIFQLFNKVGLAVRQATNGSQIPWVSTSPIDGEFTLGDPVQSRIASGITPGQTPGLAAGSGPAALTRVIPAMPAAPAPNASVSSQAVPSPVTKPWGFAAPPGISESVNPAPQRGLQGRAVVFVQDYFAQVSAANTPALAYLATQYAANVTLYGNAVSRQEVLAQKQAELARWPRRTYTLRPGSLATSCDPARPVCTISGLVDWERANPAVNARSAGASAFSFGVDLTGGNPIILSEAASAVAGKTALPIPAPAWSRPR